ncbi:hypothetical protein IWQ60_006352 [Tieghemiomyces parasiticus]|uniref:Kinesin motor domain-containing protein n=1 Tax=Tieghemiomyces parasiticus TaxID=78921 RepID=A0A9W8DXP0_9FUNG|nr:hypothetical protein IWQ60_006352 [Tieghemiomyces parasiticus]
MLHQGSGSGSGASAIPRMPSPTRRSHQTATFGPHRQSTVGTPGPASSLAATLASTPAAAGGGPTELPVQVALRIRPLNSAELNPTASHGSLPNLPRAAFNARQNHDVMQLSPDTSAVSVNVPGTGVGSGLKHFTFDHVFGQQSTQAEVYENSVVPLLDKFVDGYNVTILAYGQTSSGKTYTMGTGLGEGYGPQQPDTQGIIPRAIHTLFQFLSLQPPAWTTYQVSVSYLELYNEDLIDLLAAYEGVARPPITIREDPRGRIYWSGVREEPVYSADQVFRILEAGSQIRQTNTTDMNEKSSRSHAIFSVSLRQERYDGREGLGIPGPHTPAAGSRTDLTGGERVVIHSKFHFVDLAGSERLKRTNSVGERAREGISINAGLLALGNVISALGDQSKRATHIPYRDSKLTRLLQDSLGGNSQTLMIACVSPAEANLSETLNTLKYANRARNIKNQASLNQELPSNVDYLRGQITRLKTELVAVKAELKHYQQNGSAPARVNNRVSMPAALTLGTPSGSPTLNSAPLGTDQTVTLLRKQLEALEIEFEQLNDTYTDLLLKFNTTSCDLAHAKEELHDKTRQIIGLQSDALDASSPDSKLLAAPRHSPTAGISDTPTVRRGSRIPTPGGHTFGLEASLERREGNDRTSGLNFGLRRVSSTLRTPTAASRSRKASHGDLTSMARESIHDVSTLTAVGDVRSESLERENQNLRDQLDAVRQALQRHQAQLGAAEKIQVTHELIIAQLKGQSDRAAQLMTRAVFEPEPECPAIERNATRDSFYSDPGSDRDLNLGDVTPPRGLRPVSIVGPPAAPAPAPAEFHPVDGVVESKDSAAEVDHGVETARHFLTTNDSVQLLLSQLNQVKEELAQMRTKDEADQARVADLERQIDTPVRAGDPSDDDQPLAQAVNHKPTKTFDEESEDELSLWTLRANTRRLERQARTDAATIRQLTDEVERLRTAADEAELTLSETRRSGDTAQGRRLADLERQYHQAQQAHRDEHHTTAARISALEAELREARSRLAEAENALADERESAAHAQHTWRATHEADLVDLQERYMELEITADDLDARLAESETVRQELELQYEEKAKVVEELEAQIETLVGQLPDQGFSDGAGSGADLGAELRQADRDSGEAETGLTARRALNKPPSSAFQDLQETVARLQHENAAMVDRMTEAEQQFAAKQSARDAQNIEEQGQLSADLVAAQRDLVELRSQLEVLQAQFDQAVLDAEQAESARAATADQLARARREMTAGDARLRAVTDEVEARYATRLAELADRLDIQRRHTVDLAATHETRLVGLTQRLDAWSERFRTNHERLQEHGREIAHRLSEHEAHAEDLARDNEDLHRRLRDLEARAAASAQELEELQSALAREMATSGARIAQLRTVVTKYEAALLEDSVSDGVAGSVRSASETETRVDGEEARRAEAATLRDWQQQLMSHQTTIQDLTTTLTRLQEEQADQLGRAEEAFATERALLAAQCTELRAELESARLITLASPTRSPTISAADAAAEAIDDDDDDDDNDELLSADDELDNRTSSITADRDVLPGSADQSGGAFDGSQSDIFFDAAYSAESMVNRSLLFPNDGGPDPAALSTSAPSAPPRPAGRFVDRAVSPESVTSEPVPADALPSAADYASLAEDLADERQITATLRTRVAGLEAEKCTLLEKVTSLEQDIIGVNNRQDLVARQLEAAIDRQQFQQLHQQQLNASQQDAETPADPHPPQTPFFVNSSSSLSRSLSILTKTLKPGSSNQKVSARDSVNSYTEPPAVVTAPAVVVAEPSLTAEERDEVRTQLEAQLHSTQREVDALRREVTQLESKSRQAAKQASSMEEELINVADLNEKLEDEVAQLRQQLAEQGGSLRTSILGHPSTHDFDSSDALMHPPTGRIPPTPLDMPHTETMDADANEEDEDINEEDALVPPMSPVDPNRSMSGLFQSSFGLVDRAAGLHHHHHRGPQCTDATHARLVQEAQDLTYRIDSLQVLIEEQQSKIIRQEGSIANVEMKLREAETSLAQLQEEKGQLEVALHDQQQLLAEEKRQHAAVGQPIDLDIDGMSRHGSAPRSATLLPAESTMVTIVDEATARSGKKPPSLNLPTTSDTTSPSAALATPTFPAPPTTPTASTVLMRYTDVEVGQMRTRVARLESDIQANLNLIHTLETALTEAEQGREHAVDEREELRHQILTHTSEIKTYRDQLHQLNLQLDEAKNWADQEKRKVEMLKLKNRELAEEVAELKATKKSSGGFLCF